MARHTRESEELTKQAAEKVKKQKEQEDTARKLLEEFAALVRKAEVASDAVRKAGEPLEKPADNATILRTVAAVEKASQAAIETCTACDSFCELKVPTILEAQTIRAESEKSLEVSKAQALSAARQTALLVQRAVQQKGQVVKSVEQPLFSKRWENVFKTYDKDGDGFLNREEVLAYAKGEFGFDMSPENLDRFFRQWVHEKPGVSIEQCQRMRTAVGIALHEGRGKANQTAEQGAKEVACS
jgi:hypothetical protein